MAGDQVEGQRRSSHLVALGGRSGRSYRPDSCDGAESIGSSQGLPVTRCGLQVASDSERLASVDHKHLPGYVGGLVGGQEKDPIGDIARVAEAPQRDRPQVSGANVGLCTTSSAIGVSTTPGATALTRTR